MDELTSHAHIYLFTHRYKNHLLLPNFLLLERLDRSMHKRPTSLVCTWRGHHDLAELILCSSFHISLAQPYSSVFHIISIPEQIWRYLAMIKLMHLMTFELYWQTNWIRDKHLPLQVNQGCGRNILYWTNQQHKYADKLFNIQGFSQHHK